jgi:hypothetical protein
MHEKTPKQQNGMTCTQYLQAHLQEKCMNRNINLEQNARVKKKADRRFDPQGQPFEKIPLK